jgi:hypothetical protein
MAKGWMPNVVNEREGFRKFTVEVKGVGNGAGDLRDFKRMRQTVAKMVGVARREDLRFCFEATESSRMDNAVAVTRVAAAIRMLGFGISAATRVFFAYG